LIQTRARPSTEQAVSGLLPLVEEEEKEANRASSSEVRQLPFEEGAEAPSLLGEASWWFRVGNRTFRSPPSGLGLSQVVTDYCYIRGRHGVPKELLSSRVGGTNSVHVFHAPLGSAARSLLEKRRQGGADEDRKPCLALRQGTVVPVTFPVFPLDANYSNPLSDFGKSVESEVVDSISGPSVMDLLTELTGLPTPAWPTRSAENVSASAAAAEYLKGELESFGLQTCLQPLTWKSRCQEGKENGWEDPITWNCAGSNKNVVGYIPGSTPGAGSVTVGAHYDSRPFENATAPGADDNGSGVASLLALAKAYAKALKKHGASPSKSVYFVAFAAEEEGLFGSQAFVAGLHEGGASKKSSYSVQVGDIPSKCLPEGGWEEDAQHEAIIMDMVGWASPQLANLTVNLESYAWSKSVVEQLAQASSDFNGASLKVTFSDHPFGSDHMSWLSLGFPAALAIHGDDPSYGDVYGYYHSSGDTLDKINVPLLGMITKMNAGGLMRLSGISHKKPCGKKEKEEKSSP